MYVDDEPDLLDVAKLFLEKSHDIVVDTDLSAKDALTRVGTGQYDAVISDYQMPEMDGITFLKHLRSNGGKKIPFILFTGRGREEVVIDALNNGADYYLQKGGNPRAQFAELRNMLVQAVGRRTVESALKQSEERYRNVVENQIEAICRYKPDGTLAFVNSAYCALVGKKKEEILGKKFIPTIPPEDFTVIKKSFCSLTPANPRGCRTQRLIMEDGSVRWVLSNDRAIFDTSGNVTEFQSVLRDITEQKTAEDALHDSQKMLQYLIDVMPDAMYAIDTGGNVIVWNKAAETMTGVPADRMLGKSDHEYSLPFYGQRIPSLVDIVLHPDTTPKAPYGHVQKTRTKTLITESHVTFPDGRSMDIWITAAPLYDHDGKISGAIAVIHDVSAYKCLETALTQANRKLNLMSAVTRHGILNKLTALNQYLDLIKSETPTPTVIQRIDRVGKTAAAIRRQVDATRQYQDMGVKSPLWCSVSASFETAITHCSGSTKKLQCTNNLAGLEIYADPLLDQVFVNLIENSLVHCPEVTAISCSYEKCSNGMAVVYTDNGTGIPTSEKASIFEERYGNNTGHGLFFCPGDPCYLRDFCPRDREGR